jgi:hypothetical protein
MREPLGKELDRHYAAESRVARRVHLSHAAGPEKLLKLVRADLGAWRERHITPLCDAFGRLNIHAARRGLKSIRIPYWMTGNTLHVDRGENVIG